MNNISDFELEIINSIEQEIKNPVQIPEYEKILLYLHSLFLTTGRADIMFCNSFLKESTQLLKNSICLYKDGLFDCAFYSIRQAGEVINNMLYLAVSPAEKRKEWLNKEHFPLNSKLKAQLEKISCDYKEIKSLIPEYFSHHEELIKKAHKIIHKQGFDTFYQPRKSHTQNYGFIQEEEIKLFIETLKYTIGILLIVFIITEPMCLALSDEKVAYKINMNLMTEPINTDYFEDFLGIDYIVDKIKSSDFYQGFISSFDAYEEMLPATYGVVRDEAWDIESLDEIERQLHLISPIEQVMFHVLKSGIKVSNFYTCYGLGWYLTSIKCNRSSFSINTEIFKNYASAKERFNQVRDNVFISVLIKYDDDPLYIEHNEPLRENEIKCLLTVEEKYLSSYEKFYSLLH